AKFSHRAGSTIALLRHQRSDQLTTAPEPRDQFSLLIGSLELGARSWEIGDIRPRLRVASFLWQIAGVSRALLFLQERQERFVTFVFHSFHWNETECGRVDGVAFSGRRRRVGK